MPFEGASQLLFKRDLSSDDVGTDGKLKIVLLLVLLADKHFASSSDLIVGVVCAKPVVFGLCGIVLKAPPKKWRREQMSGDADERIKFIFTFRLKWHDSDGIFRAVVGEHRHG